MDIKFVDTKVNWTKKRLAMAFGAFALGCAIGGTSFYYSLPRRDYVAICTGDDGKVGGTPMHGYRLGDPWDQAEIRVGAIVFPRNSCRFNLI